MAGSRSAGRQSANLSPAQIRVAIPLLEARIADLQALQVEAVTSRYDPTVSALQSKIDGTLDRVFGSETNEYHRLREAKSLDAPQSVLLGPRFGGGYRTHGEPVHEIQQRIDQKRRRALALLRQEVALMKEQLGEDGSTPADRAIRAYTNLDLHP